MDPREKGDESLICFFLSLTRKKSLKNSFERTHFKKKKKIFTNHSEKCWIFLVGQMRQLGAIVWCPMGTERTKKKETLGALVRALCKLGALPPSATRRKERGKVWWSPNKWWCLGERGLLLISLHFLPGSLGKNRIRPMLRFHIKNNLKFNRFPVKNGESSFFCA